MSEHPPDPAGTQPKVDRDALLPARIEEHERPPAFDPPGPLLGPADGEPGSPGYVPARHRDAPDPPHAARFQFLLGALLAIGAVAIAGLIYTIGTGGGAQERTSTWSPWAPQSDGVEGAREIASFVAPQYRLTSDQQMVFVTASDMRIADTDLQMIVRDPAENGGEIEPLDGDAVLYRMCGLEPRCALPGKPSRSRRMLLERQALEIALYSFKYLRGVDRVALWLPTTFQKVRPAKGQPLQDVPIENQMLVFSRDEVGQLLDRPLRSTLRAPVPSVGTVREAPGRGIVQRLADRGAFSFRLIDGDTEDRAFLVLEKLTLDELLRRRASENILAGVAPAGPAATAGTAPAGGR